VLNTDAAEVGGSGLGNQGAVQARKRSWHGHLLSAEILLPPLAVLWLEP